MADKKISQLTGATTPLAGTEELPLVQGGVTKKSSVANLTAGRPISTAGYQLESGGVITEATTSRTLSATDNGKIIYCTSGSAVSIATASGLGAGFSCVVIQGGAGQIEITQGSGTTRVAFGAAYKSAGQYAAISVISPVADTFLIAGNIVA
jgi:hypothetical protein